MKVEELKRYESELSYGDPVMTEYKDGDWVRWEDVKALQKELDDMTAKAIAAAWLIPDAITCGELQNLRREAREILAGSDKHAIAKLQDELASVRATLQRTVRPPMPGVNAVYGMKAGNRHVLYQLMLTSVKHAANGGLEIEVQLP